MLPRRRGCHRRKLLGGRIKSITGIRATEAEKTMDTVTAICGRLLEEGADRNSLVLAIWKYRWMLPSDPANPATAISPHSS